MRRLALSLSLALWSCSPPMPGEDAGVTPDASVTIDAGVTDAGQDDAGVPDAGEVDAGVDAGMTDDAGSPDAGMPEDAGVDAGEPEDAGFDAGFVTPAPGFGDISGACGPLSLTDLYSPQPSTYETRIDFAMLGFDAGLLTDGGYTLYTTPNAGGSSVESEVFSYEVLHRCENATLAATETQVVYVPAGSKKTDLVISLEGEIIGVSVARAYKFPPGSALTVADATNLLNGKFSDILVSSQNVQPPWQWRKQILHVLAYDDVAKQAVIDAAMNHIDAGVRADTILYITTTDGDDAFIY